MSLLEGRRPEICGLPPWQVGEEEPVPALEISHMRSLAIAGRLEERA
jgi:hypothetical protein